MLMGILLLQARDAVFANSATELKMLCANSGAVSMLAILTVLHTYPLSCVTGTDILTGSSVHLERDSPPHRTVRQRSSTFFERFAREPSHRIDDRGWVFRVPARELARSDSTAPSVVKSSPQSTQPSTRQTSFGSGPARKDSSTRRSFLDTKPRLDMNIIR